VAEPINVLYVIWSLQMGGAERVVADLARGLDRERFRPVVCCLNFRDAWPRRSSGKACLSTPWARRAGSTSGRSCAWLA
jgi:hypothetical protein